MGVVGEPFAEAKRSLVGGPHNLGTMIIPVLVMSERYVRGGWIGKIPLAVGQIVFLRTEYAANGEWTNGMDLLHIVDPFGLLQKPAPAKTLDTMIGRDQEALIL